MDSPGLSPSAAPPGEARPTRQLLAVVAATLSVCVYVFLWALGTGPYLGDESHHYRRAVACSEAPWSDMRLTHDPAYPAEGQCAVRYFDSSGWHLALAAIWKLLGHPSFLTAQVYQLSYLFMFGVFTFLAGRKLYGNAGGWWAWALAMTMPVNLLFGMVFYMELPTAAMTAAAVYCILARRPVWFGVAMAGMFYTKLPSATVLAGPLVLGALLKMGDTWRQRLGRTALALGIAFACLVPDMMWRMEHFGPPLMFREPAWRLQRRLMEALPATTQSAIVMYIFDPSIAVQSFGVSGLLALAAATAWAAWGIGRTAWRIGRGVRAAGPAAALRSLAEDVPAEVAVAAVPMLVYMVAYIVMLRAAHDVRYFHPAVLFVALLGGGLLARARPLAHRGPRRWLVRGAAAVLVLGMIGQAATAVPFIHHRRTLPPKVLAGFKWIEQNTPPRARILYLEFNLTTVTGRPIMWAAVYPRYLFTVPEAEQARVLYYLNVKYIAIHPTRFIAGARGDIEPTGYPIPWVRSLVSRPYLAQVYPDHPCDPTGGEFVVYRIERDKIPPEWLKEPLFEHEESVRPDADRPAAGLHDRE